MKTNIVSVLSLAAAVFTLGLTACEDVPAPYGIDTTPPSKVKELPYSESFSTTLGSFENYTTDGAGEWVIDYSTAKAAGYNNTTQVTTAGTYYLVSPEISLEGKSAAHVAYEYILRYNKGDENQQVLISTTFDPTNPSQGWTVLNQTHTEGTDWTTFASANVNIPSTYMGQKIRIAFRYNTNATSGSTWEVKNFTVAEGAGDEQTPGGGEETGAKTLPYTEAFSTTLGAFESKTTSGEGKWVIDYSTAKATGYDNATQVTTAGTYYLVSPEISLAGATEAHLAYEYILRYNKGKENQQVLITTAYDDSKPAEGWTLLNEDHTEGSDWTTFSKADLAIPAEYLGKTIRIAFRYNTSTSGSTWEVKNFSIAAGKPGSTEGGGEEGGGSTEGDATASNGNFENWIDGKPNKWETASSAGNATLSQSTNAHSGKYSVEVTGTASANKRIGYEETSLPAGTYTVKFYAKAATATGGSVRPGYVVVGTDNKVQGSYQYGDYTNGLTQGEWTEVTYTFTLDSETRLSLVIMNSKNPGANVLIDDYTLTDSTGKVYIK